MEKIIEELDKFVLDEDKIEYLNQIGKTNFIIQPIELFLLCQQFIFDCNRNQMIQIILEQFEIKKINEKTLYDILKLYIFDFERNIAFRSLRIFIENPIDFESFQKLYTYANEKNILLFMIEDKNEPNPSFEKEKQFEKKKRNYTSCKT